MMLQVSDIDKHIATLQFQLTLKHEKPGSVELLKEALHCLVKAKEVFYEPGRQAECQRLVEQAFETLCEL